MKYKLDMYLFNERKKPTETNFICPMFTALYNNKDELVGTFDSYEELSKFLKVSINSYLFKKLSFTHEGDKQRIKVGNSVYWLYSFYSYKKVCAF